MRWYGYTAANYTIKPAEHIFQHYNTKFGERIKGQKRN